MLDLELLAQLVHHAVVQVGSVVGNELLRHPITANDIVLHKPSDRDLSDIFERTCHHPFGKIINGHQYEFVPI